MEGERNNTNDEEHHEAFGEQTNISEECRYEINLIKNNDPDFKLFEMDANDAANFSDLAWELLGRYIADNNHFEELYLIDLGLTNENMTHLFKHLTRSTSVKKLYLSHNIFGPGGVQSMIPFLKNAPNLTMLSIGSNHINAECFRCLVNSLHNGPIDELNFGYCNIDDITILETYLLPHLKILNLGSNNITIIPSLEKFMNLEKLYLRGNNIGKQGCRSISNLLKNEGSRLRYLDLSLNDIGDEEAEILAISLKHNTTLKDLYLEDNKIKEKALRAFLKLLNDISSIKRTSNSNHTLIKLHLSRFTNAQCIEMEKHICSSLTVNRGSLALSQRKIINTQLNSITRMELCHLQGIGYSYNSIFAEIDDVLLPNVIAVVGQKHGQNELYRMLIATAPDLASIVNRRAVLPEKIAANLAQVIALNAEHANWVEATNAALAARTAENLRENAVLAAKRLVMERELETFESGGGAHSMVGTSTLSSIASSCGKKRGRDA